jgi:hypothetical protein
MASFASWLGGQEARTDRIGGYARRAVRYSEHFPTDGPWVIEASSGEAVMIGAQVFRDVMETHDEGAWGSKRDIAGNMRVGRGKESFLEWVRSVDPEEV